MIYLEKPEGFVSQFEAVGCFVEVQNRILLLLRSLSLRIEPEKWGLPTGKVEIGEKPENAMLRELREETGLIVEPNQLNPVGQVFTDYKSFPQKFVFSMFRLVLPFFPEIVLSPEHQASVWIFPCSVHSLNLMEDVFNCVRLVYGL